MTYMPPFHGQLTSGDPLGSKSCVAYSFAMLIDAASFGADHPSGRQVREATGDTSGGLELAQCAAVAKGDYELQVTNGVFGRDVFENRLGSEAWGAVLIGGYSPIAHSAYSGEPGFTGNHAIAIIPPRIVMDPLADGRRAGIYKFDGAEYPIELIRSFAAALRLSNGQLAGPDHFEATLFPLPTPIPVTPHVRVADPQGRFNTYTVHNTGKLHVVGTSSRKLAHNTEMACSMREWPVLNGSRTILMRQLTSGPFAGLWVVAHGALPFSTGPITQPAKPTVEDADPATPAVPYDPDAAPLSGATCDEVPEEES
jgi:hypothetical protein